MNVSLNMRHMLRNSLLISAAGTALMLAPMSSAGAATICKVEPCIDQTRGKDFDNSTTDTLPVGANTETETLPNTGGAMFSISVDGQHVAGTKAPKNKQRRNDVGLDLVDIQVKFDGLDVKPILNVSTFPVRQTYQAGEQVNFLASNNYTAWITKSEVRIFEEGQTPQARPAFIVPTTSLGAASWSMPSEGESKLYYVLRVYDRAGRYDETKPLALTRTKDHYDQHAPQDAAVAPGYSDDRTAFRNIPIEGGAVTVYGSHVPAGHFVTVLGSPVPIDQDNAFVVQQILPPGDHDVDVSVLNNSRGGKGLHFDREINIPSSEWFYVAQADLTAGYRTGSANIQQVKPGEYNNIYSKGRLAFYVKGKIKGKYLLTAAGDTGESSLDQMFVGLDGKNPKEFLKRINPNDYYPVYGDDSTAVEDAPTRGKFFVRLQKDDSHVMWGNFKTQITGTEFLRNERALYGASGVYKSPESTSFGARQTEASVYAAQPGTLPQHEIIRGTGGSAYFLKHQDLTIGSETLSVELRDSVTGNIVSRTQLRYGADYEIDYIQGVVILKNPLSSSVSGSNVVTNGTTGSNEVYLIANYEFTPVAGNVDGYAFGGRGQQWIGEHVRVGVTAESEKTGGADQTLYGADILLRRSDRTFIEAEVAQSSGPGFGTSTSADGGLTISDNPTAGLAGVTAKAMRVHGHAALEDLTDGSTKGDLDAYYNRADKGFASLSKQATQDETNWGLKGSIIASEAVNVEASVDDHYTADGRHENVANAQAKVQLDEHWSIAPGVKQSLHQVPLGTDNGNRTDVGAKLTYKYDDERQAYLFGQGTVASTGNRKTNNRVGIGFETKLAEKVDLSGEGSIGDGGIGARALLNYKPTADDRYYFGYSLDPTQDSSGDLTRIVSNDGSGTFVVGAHHAYSEQLSAFAEEHTNPFGPRRSLTQTYGVKYTPGPEWTVGGGVEVGTIWDDTINTTTNLKNSDFDRKAFSGSVGYHTESGFDAHAKAEARFENSQDHTRDLNSYLLSAGFGVKTSDDWRMIGNLNTVVSEATTTTRNGTYIEGGFGFAYRPVDNDRLNALFKYTYVYDLPGADQISVGGTTNGPSQMSNILSADASYDLNNIFTIGGKYGFRFGSTKDRAIGSAWQDSSAHLGVLRLDMHVVKNWDALVEGRVLWSPSSQSTDFGALAAIYRHFGDNFKMGIGYNFGHFSDDLSHIEADDQGIFINAIGKF
jgi:hypothetical protein